MMKTSSLFATCLLFCSISLNAQFFSTPKPHNQQLAGTVLLSKSRMVGITAERPVGEGTQTGLTFFNSAGPTHALLYGVTGFATMTYDLRADDSALAPASKDFDKPEGIYLAGSVEPCESTIPGNRFFVARLDADSPYPIPEIRYLDFGKSGAYIMNAGAVMTVLPDGGVFVAAQIKVEDRPGLYIARLRPNLEVVWTRVLRSKTASGFRPNDAAVYTIPRSFTANPYGIIMAGQLEEPYGMAAMAIDLNGNELWTRRFELPYTTFAVQTLTGVVQNPKDDYNLAFCGNALDADGTKVVYLATSTSGDLQRCMTYLSTRNFSASHIGLAHGDVAELVLTTTNDQQRTQLLCVKAIGTPLWRRAYTGTTAFGGDSRTAMTSSGYLIQTTTLSNAGKYNQRIIGTDVNGLTASCRVQSLSTKYFSAKPRVQEHEFFSLTPIATWATEGCFSINLDRDPRSVACGCDLSIYVGPAQLVCAPGGSPTVTTWVSDGTTFGPDVSGRYTYLWSTGGTGNSTSAYISSTTTFAVTVTDTKTGCTATGSIEIPVVRCADDGGATGRSNDGTTTTASTDFTLQPNPATDVVTLTWADNADSTPAQISVYSIDGKLLQQQTVTNAQTTTLSIAAFKPGIYMVQLRSGDRTMVKRLVKQ